MEVALLQALGIATGGILAIGSILIVLLLLNTKQGPRTATAYVLSYTFSYFTLGNLSLWINRHNPIQTPYIGPALYTLLGLLLLLLAIRQWRNPPKPDAPPPRIFAKLDALSPFKAGIFGIVVTLLNGKNLGIFLSSMDVIASASMPQNKSILSVALVTVVFCAPLVIPLLIYFSMPKRSSSILRRMRQQIERHRHRIVLILLPLFGMLFFIRGFHDLLPILMHIRNE